jgi:hypothetical protein
VQGEIAVSTKLEQLAIKYALARRELHLAKRVFEGACRDMLDHEGKRMFDSEEGEWYYTFIRTTPESLRGKPVDDESDLGKIKRWQEAYAAKVTAAKKVGNLKGAFLRYGMNLIKETRNNDVSA